MIFLNTSETAIKNIVYLTVLWVILKYFLLPFTILFLKVQKLKNFSETLYSKQLRIISFLVVVSSLWSSHLTENNLFIKQRIYRVVAFWCEFFYEWCNAMFREKSFKWIWFWWNRKTEKNCPKWQRCMIVMLVGYLNQWL